MFFEAAFKNEFLVVVGFCTSLTSSLLSFSPSSHILRINDEGVIFRLRTLKQQTAPVFLVTTKGSPSSSLPTASHGYKLATLALSFTCCCF